MALACRIALEKASCVVLIGSDCPDLDTGYLRAAIAALETGYPAVLGPAADGGYVLLGLRRFDPSLFDGIAWGGREVFSATCQRLSALDWDWYELDTLNDIDRPEDLVGLDIGAMNIDISNLDPEEIRDWEDLRRAWP